MAANQVQTGGYECNWTEDTPDDLKCQICLMVAKDPQQHGGNKGCGKIFCKSCITLHQSNSQNCPNCREQLSLFEDKRSVRHINALEVKCDNVEKDCKWEGELGNLDTHLNICDYALLPCDNNCTNNGQAVNIFRADKQDHLINYCPRRLYQCPHCEEIGEYQEMTGTHLETCPQFSVHCPNSLFCTAAIPRCEIPAHRSTCQYECVPCKYAEVGCKEKRRRIDKEHEENDQIHLKVTTAKVLELTQQLYEQRKLLDKKLTTTVEQITFKLDGFQKHKNDKTIYSSSFYISHKGYKCSIQVHAGGAGSGEGTHVSIYAYLMKGDHDDALAWPFLGKAIFELLNQIKDENHHKATTKFNSTSKSSKRVVDGERSGNGRGKHKFIAHTDLAYNPANNCQYLKDDALIFRVSVQPPSYKPWLQCNHE